MTFAPCESLGYGRFSESLTYRYPSSLLWEDLHEYPNLVRFDGSDIYGIANLHKGAGLGWCGCAR